MVHLSELAPELLIAIFKLATDNPVRDLESQTTWVPFESACSTSVTRECRNALRTKSALSLVCSLFRRLSLELLYEDIWIRRGSDALFETLESTREAEKHDPGLGGYVRRISISLVEGGESRQTLRSIYKNSHRIFLCCPNIRAISHFRDVRAEGEEEGRGEDEPTGGLPIDDIDLPFLHRVDWHNMPFNVPLSGAPSPRFIWHSHTLNILIIGADDVPLPSTNVVGSPNQETETEIQMESTIINLPNLHTLGIFSSNTFVNIIPPPPPPPPLSPPRRDTISLPSLRRVFIGRPDAINNFFAGCLARLLEQITTLEIGPDPHFLRHDFVTALLGYCPSVTELYIPIVTTRPLSKNSPQNLFFAFVVRRIYLYLGPLGKQVDKDSRWWTLLQGHFEGMCGDGTRVPVLECIVLCGWEWKDTIEDAQFIPMLRIVHSKGIRIECDVTDLQLGLSKLLETLGKP